MRHYKLLAPIGLAAATLLSACTDGAPFRERGKVLRFGPAPTYDRYVDGIRRPLPSSSDAVVRLQVPYAHAGTLWISVRTNDDQAAGESCTAKLLDSSGTSIATASVKLERKDVWTEISLPLEESSGTRTLELTCTRPAMATWSQPYVVPKRRFARAQPLIVLLSVDTLRADHVEGFGAPPGATPAMGQLGKEGLRAIDAASEFTWTMPAHIVLLYSRMFGFGSPPQGLSTIASVLAKAGFATGAFTGGGFVSAAFRMHYGFDRFLTYSGEDQGKLDVEVLPDTIRDAQSWVLAHRDAATFLFLHTYAPHTPPPIEQERNRKNPFLLALSMPPEEELAGARDWYRSLVRRTDQTLAPFLDWLREQSTVRPVLLILLSDHGEAFGEHGNFRHGSGGPLVTLHDEVIRIPLIFWSPGFVSPERETRIPIGLVDIAPTILAAAGLAPAPGMVGESMWPRIAGGWREWFSTDDVPERAVISYKDAADGAPGSWSARTHDLKVIGPADYYPLPEVTEFYRLSTDPLEKSNLATHDSVGFAAGVEKLWEGIHGLEIPHEGFAPLPKCTQCAWTTQDDYLDSIDPNVRPGTRDKKSNGIDANTEERLKSLGYLR